MRLLTLLLDEFLDRPTRPGPIVAHASLEAPLMTWRTWDQWLADTTQSGGRVVSRTDNGVGPAVEAEDETWVWQRPGIYSNDPTENRSSIAFSSSAMTTAFVREEELP
jgi:hypothetical protein